MTTKERRSYNQFCPLARALDVLGERWTLLVVRELMSGPKRFTDLQDSLVGIGTNLLSARLKEMERGGLIGRRKLPPPGVATVYELTAVGRGLDATLMSLIRWGIPLLAQPRGEDEHFRPHWLLHGMLSSFHAALAEGVSDTFEFQVAGEVFHIDVAHGQASGDMGYAYRPGLVWSSDEKRFMELVFRVVTPEASIARGELQKGSREQLVRVLDMFDPFGPSRHVGAGPVALVEDERSAARGSAKLQKARL